MENLYNPYDNGPIAPFARVKEGVGLWMGQRYEPFQIDYIEPIQRSSPFTVDIIALTALAGVTGIAPYAFIPAMLIPMLQMNEGELFHARWMPLDDVEGSIYQLSGLARNAMRGGQARTSLLTQVMDPNLSSTTFWIYGSSPAKDAYVQTVNPNPIPAYVARFAFWGFRYMLTKMTPIVTPQFPTGYEGVYPKVNGNITYIPAQGR